MTRRQRVIVIVEDDAPTLHFLCELLEEEGYLAIGCRTANEAYAWIQREQPDLVILDAHLDGSVGGLAILELLRLTPATAELPAIICSADTKLLKETVDVLALANCAVVEKPFDMDGLVQIVRRMSSQPGQARQPQAYEAWTAPTTLRATKRLSPHGPSSNTKASAVCEGIDHFTSHDLRVGPQVESQGTEQAVLRSTQQLCQQSQLLTQQAHRLRETTAHLIQELQRTQVRIDTAASMRAMAGPRP